MVRWSAIISASLWQNAEIPAAAEANVDENPSSLKSNLWKLEYLCFAEICKKNLKKTINNFEAYWNFFLHATKENNIIRLTRRFLIDTSFLETSLSAKLSFTQLNYCKMKALHKTWTAIVWGIGSSIFSQRSATEQESLIRFMR